MSSVPGSAISIADGEITIDAELLAFKLGLSAALLKAEMRKGMAYIYLANAGRDARLNPLKDSTICPYSASPNSTTKPPPLRS
jgi:hypothetical protein